MIEKLMKKLRQTVTVIESMEDLSWQVEVCGMN